MIGCAIVNRCGWWCCALSAALTLSAASCKRSGTPGPSSPAPVHSPIQLQDVTQQTGITFVHTDGHSGQHYIVETVTAGLALFDYDNDGWIDIYFVNGAPLKGAHADTPPTDALYRNEGGWRFRDVTREAGVGETGYGLGTAVADYDNDGDLDIYVNNYGPSVLYRNEGDGTFTDVTATAGVGAGESVGAGVSFLDIDADGLLDLYVGKYVDFTYENHVTHAQQGYVIYAGPRDFHPAPDFLFHNNGDGTFSDISQSAGIRQCTPSTMGIVSADYDNDGDTDIFVLSDVDRNYLYVNGGRGLFEERGLIAGAGYNTFGDSLGSMGIDCGDYDNDGFLDFLQTSYQDEFPVLFRNLGNGCLEDVTRITGAGEGSLPYVNWGVGFVDFDNDGDRDLYIAEGHLQDDVDQYDDSTAYEVRNVLLMNDGQGKFLNVSSAAGDGMLPKLSSRGAAFDDLDNDGNVDVVVLNSRRESTVIRNVSQTGNHWIQIRLRGVTTNRDGVGSHVYVTAGGRTQLAEVHSGRSYQSHFGTTLQFGLGPHARAERIEVRWLGGGTQVLEDVSADRLVTVVQK
jgi:enediyne biosynthesis protein E4